MNFLEGMPNVISRVLKEERIRDAAYTVGLAALWVIIIDPYDKGRFFDLKPPDFLGGRLSDILAPFVHAYANRFLVGRNINWNRCY